MEYIQAEPSIVPLLFSEIVFRQYFHVALVTILVYQSLIMLDKEIKYFWSNPRSSVSWIYFANHYAGLLGAICNIADVVTIVLIDYILLIRVLALYHNNTKLSVCLKLMLPFLSALRMESRFARLSDSGVTLYILSWIIPITFGLILLILALYKAAEHWRASSGLRGLELVRVVIRDQFLYYGFVIFCCVLKIVTVAVENPIASVLLVAVGSPTLLCILGGQLLINLKEAGERGANGGTNYTPKSVSSMEFA
ncbi:hypothetical protein A7U60_g2242 [Sanghuangporus baumii]|uniref:DUF6533 domain-containing protein n=1 Tax=Sanghuangporus baumii TaxID=108892 RepID=A0A9Q5I2J6_SANBA|nr:hypothetical protein A7U60_g2242 [Sanghuangporus baumii]